MKWLALLLIIPCAIFADEGGAPTGEQMQARLDAAIASADRYVISALTIEPSKENAATYRPVWESTPSEMAAISKYLRLQPPPPSVEIADGQEMIRAMTVGSHSPFTITFKARDADRLTIHVWPSGIGCELIPYGVVGVDRTALAPFYDATIHRIHRLEAERAAVVAPGSIAIGNASVTLPPGWRWSAPRRTIVTGIAVIPVDAGQLATISVITSDREISDAVFQQYCKISVDSLQMHGATARSESVSPPSRMRSLVVSGEYPASKRLVSSYLTASRDEFYTVELESVGVDRGVHQKTFRQLIEAFHCNAVESSEAAAR